MAADNEASGISHTNEQHRRHLVAARMQAQGSWDKTLLWLAAGALGLSLTFVGNLDETGGVRGVWVLAAGWLVLVMCLLLVLVSFALSRFALEKAIRQIDAGEYGKPGGYWSWATDLLNVLAGLACMLGIVLVLLFAFLNLRGGSHAL